MATGHNLAVLRKKGWAKSNDAGSLRKIAVLIGLVIVVGGAEISKVGAATLTQTETMPSIQTVGALSQSNSAVVDFNQFNTALGTLTDVQFTLTSVIDVEISAQGFNPTIAATVQIDDVQIGPTGSAPGNSGSVFSFGPTEAVLSPPALSFYEGSSTFGVSLSLNVSSGEIETIATWDSLVDDALAFTYTYTPAISGTPLPAGLPLFATGVVA